MDVVGDQMSRSINEEASPCYGCKGSTTVNDYNIHEDEMVCYKCIFSIDAKKLLIEALPSPCDYAIMLDSDPWVHSIGVYCETCKKVHPSFFRMDPHHVIEMCLSLEQNKMTEEAIKLHMRFLTAFSLHVKK